MFMRIWCQRCGGSYEVYDRDDVRCNKARTCPHCQEKVTAAVWEKVVEAHDAYKLAELALASDDTSKTRFTVDFMDDSIYKNSRTAAPAMD